MFNDTLDYGFWFKAHALVMGLATLGTVLILAMLSALRVPMVVVSIPLVASLGGCLGGFALLVVGLVHRHVHMRELWRGLVAYILLAGILLSLTVAATTGV